jgi:hypothetical protein
MREGVKDHALRVPPMSDHAFRHAARAAFLVAALVLVLPSARAERVEPPLELLYAPANVLVAGPVVETAPSGRLVLRRKDVLSARERPPELIDVRVPKAALETLKPGDRVIVGYTLLRPDPRNPSRAMLNPAGAIILSSIGLEPALFRDTPQARALLAAGSSEHGRESRRLFDLLLKALAGSDTALRTLAAGEFAQDLELGERLREGHGRDVIEKVARDPQAPPGVRTTLLVAAHTRPADFGPWWADVASGIVTTTPTGGYAHPASDPEGLVLTALELLDGQAKVPPEALQRWLRSPSPPIAERASLMLRRQSPALERSSIQQALADPTLPANTRRFLNDHLRRLDRLDARLKARKEGTR